MIVKIARDGGRNKISVDGETVDSLAFKSFRPTENNVGDFYAAGVRIFHVYCSGMRSGINMLYSLYGEPWVGDGEYRFEVFDRQMEFFEKNAPEGYVFVNIQLDTRDWWLREHEGLPSSFTHLSQVAADEDYRRDTAEFLKALLRHAEDRWGDRILGYYLVGGHTNEWFSDFDYEASHPTKLAAYRRYTEDQKAEIPTEKRLIRPSREIFLDPTEDRDVIEYRRFHARLISDTVLYFCREAQEVLCHNKLLGVFFGYIMELSGERMWNAGHLDLDRVNGSPDIDLIATPSSYRFRQYEDFGAHMTLDDSLELSGKVYFASFDNLTCTVPTLESNTRRICGDESTMDALYQLIHKFKRLDTLETYEKTVQGMRREMMLRLAKRCGTWWFDMLEGWYYDERLMDEVRRLRLLSERLDSLEMNSASEICVLADCESLYYVNKCSGMNDELLTEQREGLGRLGAPYDLYSMSDLPSIDIEKYKLFIFLNAYSLTDEQRRIIKERVMSGGRSTLFVGAPDYISDRGVSLARVEKLLGMRLLRLGDDEARSMGFGTEYGYGEAKSPTFFIDDESVLRLGEFKQSGQCSLGSVDRGDHTVYYSSLGHIHADVLREIARLAGVHIYAEGGVPVYVNDALIGVYNTNDGVTAVSLPEDGEYEEIFSGKRYVTECGKVTLPTGKSPAQMLRRIK